MAIQLELPDMDIAPEIHAKCFRKITWETLQKSLIVKIVTKYVAIQSELPNMGITPEFRPTSAIVPVVVL